MEASCNYGIGKDGRVCLVVDEACGDGCTLSQQKPDDTIEIDLDLDELDATVQRRKRPIRKSKIMC